MSYDYTVEGFSYPSFNLTFKLSGSHTDMNALEGLAVEQDATSANTVKLAGDGAQIVGVILVAEDGRAQGEGITVTVAMKGGHRMTYAGESAPAVGSYLVGAGAGAVKAAGSGVVTDIRVWEVDSANTNVIAFQK